MLAPYGLEIIEGCLSCKMRSGKVFCDLPDAVLQAFEQIKHTTAYPRGAILFVEGQAPRGVFVICKGSVKLSVSASDGKTLILEVADAGEVLGVAASISNQPYTVTAETAEACQVSFVRREDFVQFLMRHPEAGLRVSEQLSANYHAACRELRSLALSHSAAEKLATLLLEWVAKSGEDVKPERRAGGGRGGGRGLGGDREPHPRGDEEAGNHSIEGIDLGNPEHRRVEGVGLRLIPERRFRENSSHPNRAYWAMEK